MTDPQAQPQDEPQTPAISSEEVSRRVFNRLSMAAFSGLVAGSIVGCDTGEEGGGGGGGNGMGGGGGTGGGGGHGHGGGGHAGVATTEGEEVEPFDWTTAEKHVCRGLNNCRNKGASEMNDCAGQGTCATFPHNECAGQNACVGQGGCGEAPGENRCEGKGGCHVPLHEGAMWDAARQSFEEAMEAAGKEFGPAPELN